MSLWHAAACAKVESRAIVGAMSVAGRPVKSDLQLVGIGLRHIWITCAVMVLDPLPICMSMAKTTYSSHSLL